MEPTSTCSLVQLSMLSDLTLLMCVPSFRWIAAQRMHRNMPNYQLLANVVPLPLSKCSSIDVQSSS